MHVAGTERRGIAIVTDSSCDLPKAVVDELNIQVIPLLLHVGEETLRDGVDIDAAAFYALLESSMDVATSSQPKAVEFEAVFRRLAERYEGIVAVLVSSGLSGTVNSALVAASRLPELAIEIIDSQAVSMQLGYMVEAAGCAARAGGDLQTVAGAAKALIDSAHVFFVVDTLEYLHRGGRIGAAAKLFGSVLDLKPVLGVADGIVVPLARIRTRSKAVRKLTELVGERVSESDRSHMAVLHIACPQEAEALAEQLRARFKPTELMIAECGPVIGAHAGPGTVGVAFYVD